jgi:hypothetical protein
MRRAVRSIQLSTGVQIAVLRQPQAAKTPAAEVAGLAGSGISDLYRLGGGARTSR